MHVNSFETKRRKKKAGGVEGVLRVHKALNSICSNNNNKAENKVHREVNDLQERRSIRKFT